MTELLQVPDPLELGHVVRHQRHAECPSRRRDEEMRGAGWDPLVVLLRGAPGESIWLDLCCT